jgi:pimeloyl-ACP methyl ester carboxylesterase
MQLTPVIDPPNEPCIDRATEVTGFFDAPSTLIDCQDPNCGRLIPNLRRLAQTKNAKEILISAAFVHYMLRRPEVGTRYPIPPSFLFAQASADLAVTGQEAYSSFRQFALREADLIEPVRNRILEVFPSRQPVLIDVSGAVQQALQRSYQVAWALRGPAQHRKTQRPGLGWVAVDGEDDPPHRPVNVPSALYPQYNMTVQVNATPVVTRYVVASRHITDNYPVDIHAIPPDRSLPLIVGDIILFIHGHSSSLEEAMPLIGPLLDQADDKGRPVTLIAMDLPSNGYSSMIEHTDIAAPEMSLWNTGYPILDFIENFIVAFVDQLEAQQSGIKRQIIGVIGGSLGGNMTLRLGRRDPAVHPWLHSVVSWSPASTWISWARAVLGIPLKNRYSCVIHHEGVGRTSGAMMEKEVESPYFKSSLNKFFYQEFAGKGVGRVAQADHWYSESWPCRESTITGSHRSIYEIYNSTFRRWHWRVAHEQLIFSHWDSDNRDLAVDPDPRNDPRAGPARYSQIKSRVLLATGSDDDHKPEKIYSCTKGLASAMTMVNGTTLFLKNTGHAIPTERPIFFANRVLEFLFVTPLSSSQRTDISFLVPLLLSEPR